MMANPAQFEATEFDDAEDIMRVNDAFYLVEPLVERWGKRVLFKSTCWDFFSCGMCGQSLAMSLVYDTGRTLLFPVT